MESDLFAVSSEQGGHQNFLKFATVTWNMNSGGAARKAEGWLCPWHTKWSAFAPSADYLKLLKLIKAAAQMYKEALVRAARHQTHLWPCSSNQQRHPLNKMANLKVSRLNFCTNSYFNLILKDQNSREFDLILNSLIAIGVLYHKSFGSNPIGPSVR